MIMKFLNKIKQHPVLLALCFLLALPPSYYLGRNYYDDNYVYHFVNGMAFRTHVSNFQIASSFIRNKPIGFVDFISRCKFFPSSVKSFFVHDSFSKDKECAVLSDQRVKNIWIDPWGRPYQIRYDRERRKLQVRSQGRYLSTEWDDIVGESTWGGIGNMMNEEIKKCELLPKNDMSCIFNRGWH